MDKSTVLASGGSEQAAVAAVAIVAIAAAAVAADVAADVAVVIAADVAVVIAVIAVVAVVAVAVIAVVAAENLGVPKRWTLTAYGIEASVIAGALYSGSIGWAVAIGAVGILALLTVWKFGPRAALNASPASAASAPATNGG